MSVNGIPIVFGGGIFWTASVEETSAWLKLLKEFDISTIDTAQGYGTSQDVMGEAGAASQFTIDTKFSAVVGPTKADKETVIASGKDSLKKLKTDQVDVYYIHGPDRRVPFKETLEGINELYKQGAFKRFGLSNFRADEVEEVVRIAKENNFVLPTVYQGNYNAVARRTETEIIPTLRKHGIALYAYSPIAGGFLSKSKEELVDPNGRFGKGDHLAKLYNGLYNHPSYVAALDDWQRIAQSEGATRAELAYRWIFWHSQVDGKLGDAIIVGASRESQLRETMDAVKKGPLSAEALKGIDQIWEDVKADAPLDNFEVIFAQNVNQ
ncbi:aflatoxin B1 aldehyde reductase member 3 [Cercophora newfieldiana]|uniref:Aflatoxin B1 aldehyde reductase member 3 n=1 Tax=Cercophora newfieldiana TaxID=92897 RepID=A0AA40CRP5_9PEZI|nr:aflatoxin B1 aldehyde reductase member 3 [Cercophora newfieldiana]